MRERGNIAAALILIGIGAWFLAIELSPVIKAYAYGVSTWPVPIIGIGAYLALTALLTWSPGLLIPACIVAGVGGLLYWQNSTGRWESWAYTWALIPVFVGMGLLFYGAAARRRGALVGGGWTIFNGLALFAIFGAFLGGLPIVSRLWPVLLVALGVICLARAFYRR